MMDGIVNKYFTNADGGLIDSDFKDSNLYNTAYENLGQYLLTMPAGADRDNLAAVYIDLSEKASMYFGQMQKG